VAQAAWTKRQAAWEEARSELARRQQLLLAADLAAGQAEQAAAGFDGAALLARRQALAEQVERLRDLGDRLRKCGELVARAGELRARLGGRLERRAQVARELQRTQEGEAAARRAVELAGHAARALQAAATQHAEALRAKLVDGEPCAVCGSCEHPYAEQANEVLRREVRRLDAELREGEAALEAQVKRLAELGAEELQLGQAIGEDERSAALLEQEAATARASSRERMSAELREVGGGEEAELSWVGAQREALGGQLRILEAQERSRLAAETAQTLRRKEAAGARAAVEQSEAAAKGEQEALDRLAEEVQSSAEEGAAQAKRVAAHRQALATEGFDGGPGFDDLLERDPKAAIRRQSDAVDAWRAHQEELGKREKELQQRSAQLGQLRLGLEHAQAGLANAELRLAERTELHDGLSRERAAVFAGGEWQGRSVQEVAEELARRSAQAEEGRTRARRAVDPAVSAKGAQEGLVAKAKEELLRLADGARSSRAALDAWRAGALRGPAEGEAWLRAVLATSPATLAARRAGAQKVTEAYAALAAVLRDRTGQLEEHRRLQPSGEPVEALRSALAEAELEQAEQEKSFHSLDAALAADAEDRLRVADLSAQVDRQRQTLARWEQLNSLIGSENGKKFSRIAHELTLDLLVKHANHHLATLSKRYRLERIAATLGILVVDQDMGNEVRSVHSLSGGESFLVSLALALGLASLSSSRVRVESLFIDEGFGTLDPETLSVATGALEQLQAHGRKVGVISHVKEMAERIGTIVEVAQGPGGGAKVRVRGGVPLAG
jgi:exonuclease SbcC